MNFKRKTKLNFLKILNFKNKFKTTDLFLIKKILFLSVNDRFLFGSKMRSKSKTIQIDRDPNESDQRSIGIVFSFVFYRI